MMIGVNGLRYCDLMKQKPSIYDRDLTSARLGEKTSPYPASNAVRFCKPNASDIAFPAAPIHDTWNVAESLQCLI
jgi:hypothetical protein